MSQYLMRLDLTSKNGAGTTVTHRYATESYYTSAGSTPASTYIDGRLRQPGLITRTMHGENMLRGGIPIGSGAAVLDNLDGSLDSLLDYAYDGMEWVLYEINRATGAVASVLRRGYTEQPIASTESITFALRDVGHALDIPLLQARYGGTNALPAGLDGTPDDIGGQAKPAWLGYCRNVAPVCINTARQIYQVDGQRGLLSGWSMAVFDARATITASTNYSSQSDMETNAPSAGQVRWWPAGGMFRLGSAPVGRVTVDGLNPAHSGFGAESISAILRGLMEVAGLSKSLVPHFDVDADAGIYVQDDRTLLNAMSEVLASVSGYLSFGVEPEGSYGDVFWASQLAEPLDLPYSVNAPVLELNASSVKTESIEPATPGDAERGLPIWRVNLKYARNFTPMSATDLAGLALGTQAEFAQDYKTISVSDAAVKTKWPYATELNVVTLLTDDTQATAEAQRLLALHKVERRLYQATPPGEYVRMCMQPFGGVGAASFDIGSLVYLEWPRFGLNAGKVCLVVGMATDYMADTRRLTVWG